ncbi:alpha-L-rhamnosidase C-terminal domain-containing protein [Nonomuraea sp. NPDC049750]|uniref:alpha-L-rhamnosidase C-terminal domain-containing protein n=1 Tax=Nonomuraea sp. NPDC049750 TaxID=3154738 RepID=UPI0033FA155E
MQQRVGGLRATSPGWASFDIRPVVDDRVTWGRISHGTVRGVATVEWARTGDQWDVGLQVPAGATARLVLPGGHSRQFGGGSHTFLTDLYRSR